MEAFWFLFLGGWTVPAMAMFWLLARSRQKITIQQTCSIEWPSHTYLVAIVIGLSAAILGTLFGTTILSFYAIMISAGLAYFALTSILTEILDFGTGIIFYAKGPGKICFFRKETKISCNQRAILCLGYLVPEKEPSGQN